MSKEKIAELEKVHRSLRDKRKADHAKAVIAFSKGILLDFLWRMDKIMFVNRVNGKCQISQISYQLRGRKMTVQSVTSILFIFALYPFTFSVAQDSEEETSPPPLRILEIDDTFKIKNVGGPVGQYSYSFSFEAQLFAANDYVVVRSNPRGSSGYGRDFCFALYQGCGEKDWNVPVQNSEQLYQALRRRGITTRLVVYPGEHHGGWSTAHEKDFLERRLSWCDQYVKGEASGKK